MKANKVRNIEISCAVPEYSDEKGANGLWDLAGQLALKAGVAAANNGLLRDPQAPIYGEELGQGAIYDTLRDLTISGTTTTRLRTLLRNALTVIEQHCFESVMGTDIEDEIGITWEEYDEIMEDTDE